MNKQSLLTAVRFFAFIALLSIAALSGRAADGFANVNATVTGGAAGPTVYVTSEAQLQQYSDVDAPYTIYVTASFPLSGMSTHIRSNKTVIGVGNIVLSGGGLYLYRASNVIIQNLTIDGSTEDGIGLHYSNNVWIDHCTIKNSSDGGIDITQASDYITISWCKFIYDTNSGHNFVNLIGSSDSDNGSQYHVTFHHNWWSSLCVERMPSVRFGRAHIYNNYFNAPGNGYCVRTRIDAQCLVEGNFFENVKNPWERYEGGNPGLLRAVNNNVPYLGTANGVTWAGGGSSVLIPGTDTVFTPPYAYSVDTASNARAAVIAGAGAGGGSPPSPPAAPSSLTASATSSSQINLTWADNANNESGFSIERATGAGAFAVIANVGANVTSYSSTGLAASTAYSYRVRATNAGGSSAYSNTASATTQPASTLPPVAPSSLTATVVSSSQINLAWTDNANNETGYSVERATGTGAFAVIASLGGNVTSYQSTGLAAATTYSFRVRASNSAGNSAYSNTATATTQSVTQPPATPTGLTATAGNAQVSLSWSASSGATSYNVKRATVSGGPYTTVGTATSTSFTNSGLTNGTTYYFVVSAVNSVGESANSTQASATPTAPSGNTLTFTSLPTEDGRVQESSESSNSGGSTNSADATAEALRTGDDASDRQFKSVLSFDTSSIPDGATIVSATLRIRRGSLTGTNPFTTHGSLFVDIKAGTGFSNSASLQTGDFQATADAAQVAALTAANTNGDTSTGVINATGRTWINKTGKTQFRVYFSLDDNDDTGADYIGWFSGNDATAANRPILEITYQ